MNKYDRKMTRKQVLQIPKLLPKYSIEQVAIRFSVSWQAIWYWVKKLRESGIEVKTRKKGRKPLNLKTDKL